MTRRRKNPKNIRRRFLDHLKKPATIDDLADTFNTTKKHIYSEIRHFRDRGFHVKKEGDHYYLQLANEPETHAIEIPETSTFAVMGDTHLGSKHESMDELRDYYKWAEDNGAEFFVHAGDLMQGIGVFRGEEAEIHKFTMEDQLQYFIDEYPESDLQTFYIFGNHDLKQFEKGKSPHPRHVLESAREDLTPVGDYYARLIGDGTDISIDLLHPAGGSSYARSYRPQKYIEQLPPGNEPSILVWGHHHDALYLPYRGVHTFKSASFQGHSNFARRLGLPGIIGGWLLTIEHDGSEINTMQSEFREYRGG